MAEEQKEQITPSEILDRIIALTYTRHAGLPYEEFAEKTGIDKEKPEDQAVREGKFKLLRAITRKGFDAINEIRGIREYLEACFEEKGDK